MKKNKLISVLVSIIGKVKSQDKKVKYGVILAVGIAIAASTQIDAHTQEVIVDVLESIIESL